MVIDEKALTELRRIHLLIEHHETIIKTLQEESRSILQKQLGTLPPNKIYSINLDTGEVSDDAREL